MKYSIEHNDKIAIFTLKHEKVDSDVAAEFKAKLLIVCQPDIDGLIIDLSPVEMIDSSGLGALLLAHRQLKEYGIPLYLVGVHGMVKTLIQISQIEGLFRFTDSVDEAVDELNRMIAS